MNRTTRALTSLAVAGGVALSGTGVAHAQSSSAFIDLSSSLSSLLPGDSSRSEDPVPHEELVERLKSGFDAVYDHAGVPVNGELREAAKEYAGRAAAGEFEFEPVPDGTATGAHLEQDGDTNTAILQLTPEQAEALAGQLEGMLTGDLGDGQREALRTMAFGVASDDDHIYVATHAGRV